jgi:hypothetical protein
MGGIGCDSGDGGGLNALQKEWDQWAQLFGINCLCWSPGKRRRKFRIVML